MEIDKTLKQQVVASGFAYSHLADYVFELRETITPLKEDWKGRSDARRMALGNLNRILAMPALLFNMLSKLGEEEDLAEFGRLTGLDQEPKDRPDAFRNLVKFAITGTVLNFQFEVENLFQNLYRELGGTHEERYLELARALLKKAGLDANRIAPITALAHLRNSMHNNGVHGRKEGYKFAVEALIRHAGKTIKIVGGPLVFQPGKPVLYEGPLHILAVMSLIIDVVHDVLLSEAISAIPGPIPDRFAEQNALAKHP